MLHLLHQHQYYLLTMQEQADQVVRTRASLRRVPDGDDASGRANASGRSATFGLARTACEPARAPA